MGTWLAIDHALLSLAIPVRSTDYNHRTKRRYTDTLGPRDAGREEIITVLKETGWKKTLLYNLKFLDSCMKENQMLKPNVLGTSSSMILISSVGQLLT